MKDSCARAQDLDKIVSESEPSNNQPSILYVKKLSGVDAWANSDEIQNALLSAKTGIAGANRDQNHYGALVASSVPELQHPAFLSVFSCGNGSRHQALVTDGGVGGKQTIKDANKIPNRVRNRSLRSLFDTSLHGLHRLIQICQIISRQENAIAFITLNAAKAHTIIFTLHRKCQKFLGHSTSSNKT
jgi:hypothetical protein